MNACTASPHVASRAATAMTAVAIGLFHAGSLSAAGPTGTTFTPSGPITLTSGQVVTGLQITNPSGPCINGSGVTNVRITNNKIGPCGSTDTGVGVNLYQAGGIRVDHNSFDDIASALYVIQGGNDIVFEQNHATRIRGPLPRGQMVQFNNVRGTGHKVMCNVSDQTTPGYLAGPEDHVSMYASSGTAASPIDIAFNKIRGGGPSQTGGGMLAGDTGSDNVTIRDNILIHPGQYGIAIAGGSNIRLLRNRVYSRTVFPWSNIGAYVWSQYGASCSGNEVRGNQAFYLSRNGVANPFWNAGNCGAVAGESENIWEWGTTTALSEAMWNEQIPACAESGAAPGAPGNLAATISRTTAPANVNLTWTASATGATSTIIERAPQGGAYAVVTTLAANATSHVDPNIAGGTWLYRVKARGTSGDSAYSNSATVSIAAAPATPPVTETPVPPVAGTPVPPVSGTPVPPVTGTPAPPRSETPRERRWWWRSRAHR
ncbi:MAG: hypothetical protein ACKVQT_07715 [Burkholderiales bacterium]